MEAVDSLVVWNSSHLQSLHSAGLQNKTLNLPCLEDILHYNPIYSIRMRDGGVSTTFLANRFPRQVFSRTFVNYKAENHNKFKQDKLDNFYPASFSSFANEGKASFPASFRHLQVKK